jgi:hypothetical protein
MGVLSLRVTSRVVRRGAALPDRVHVAPGRHPSAALAGSGSVLTVLRPVFDRSLRGCEIKISLVPKTTTEDRRPRIGVSA